MSYIKDEKHFINYLNKVLRANPDVNAEQILSGKFYIKEIYASGLADEYAWALKQEGAHLLEEERVLEWLAHQRTKHIREYDFTHSLTQAFIELSEDLAYQCGVYSFWNEHESPLYVGRSIRIGHRMMASFGERFKSYDRPIFVRYIVTNSGPDASLLEIYFIATLNPPFNSLDNYDKEELTLTVSPIPEWSNPIRCNLVIYQGEERTHGA